MGAERETKTNTEAKGKSEQRTKTTKTKHHRAEVTLHARSDTHTHQSMHRTPAYRRHCVGVGASKATRPKTNYTRRTPPDSKGPGGLYIAYLHGFGQGGQDEATIACTKARRIEGTCKAHSWTLGTKTTWKVLLAKWIPIQTKKVLGGVT